MTDRDGNVYVTPAEIAEKLGRTAERVRQLVRGQCGCQPLPADRVVASGCAGAGRILTDVTSLSAWVDTVWSIYPLRW